MSTPNPGLIWKNPLREYPYESAAAKAAHTARLAEHNRYLARCAENLAAECKADGNYAGEVVWQLKASKFRDQANRLVYGAPAAPEPTDEELFAS